LTLENGLWLRWLSVLGSYGRFFIGVVGDN